MAKVLQCDACKKVVEALKPVMVDGKTHECCAGCTDRVLAVLNPKPRGPRPAAEADA